VQFAFESPTADILELDELIEPVNPGFERRFAHFGDNIEFLVKRSNNPRICDFGISCG
jgi:hypothetical protein